MSVSSLGTIRLPAASTSSCEVTVFPSRLALLLIPEKPSTRVPPWRATVTSGTVDIPTESAPAVRRKRRSAGVSKDGPLNPT